MPNGCPVINKIDADGSCASSMQPHAGSCAGYCEVRNYYFYGRETPFKPSTLCTQNIDCTVTDTYTATVSQSFSFNVDATLNIKRSESSDAKSTLEGAFDIVRFKASPQGSLLTSSEREHLTATLRAELQLTGAPRPTRPTILCGIVATGRGEWLEPSSAMHWLKWLKRSGFLGLLWNHDYCAICEGI